VKREISFCGKTFFHNSYLFIARELILFHGRHTKRENFSISQASEGKPQWWLFGLGEKESL
jgi:hypothetical protein